MFVMNIKDLIGEATEYDKKFALEEKKPKSWCKSVSAFANTFGGALIFGISDAGQIVGLDDPEGDAEKISEAVKFIKPMMKRFWSYLKYIKEMRHHTIIQEMVCWKLLSVLEMKV